MSNRTKTKPTLRIFIRIRNVMITDYHFGQAGIERTLFTFKLKTQPSH